jgi:D-alanine-D-alanine ligase
MKKRIAIIAGGDSSESGVSLRSARSLYNFIDRSLYSPFIVIINKKQWYVKGEYSQKYPVDKNDFTFRKNTGRIKFDFAYITIHGTPGENGLLQGYFELLGIPYSTCSLLTSAITFSKFTCNQYLKGFGVTVSESLLLRTGQTISPEEVAEKVGYPCFVKPNAGGSSFGVTKVKKPEELQTAIAKAFSEDGEVMIEAFMPGTEITCGMYKTKDHKVVLPVTEVVPANEFFDYDAKYNGQVQEITPARISEELSTRVQQLTAAIYDILDCKGIVRIDYIISENNTIRLLEVNTTPGMTATSFIPQQVKAAGLSMTDVLTEIIENELDKINSK